METSRTISKALALIPARGGSKRLPGKNIRPFFGKPIIAYPILAARESGLFDEVMVSTDDPVVAETGIRFGASVPFLRSPGTSDDHATVSDVIEEVLQRYAAEARKFDAVCLLYPTAAFVTPSMIRKGYEMLKDGSMDAVWYVVQYGYPIQRALSMTDGRLSFTNPDNRNTRSQDLAPSFHDAGQMFWLRSERFLRSKNPLPSNTGAVELAENEVQDIDTLQDWNLAELKYKMLRKLS